MEKLWGLDLGTESKAIKFCVRSQRCPCFLEDTGSTVLYTSTRTETSRWYLLPEEPSPWLSAPLPPGLQNCSDS